MKPKEIYTTGEIAKLCGVNFQTVLRWIQRGQLKAFQLPGRGDNRVKRYDLIRFLEDNHIPLTEALTLNNQILVIDDDVRMAKSMQRTLKNEGFDALICTEGFKAGVMVTSLLPKLIILDLNMPGVGGLEILKYIRGLDMLKGIKILIVSAMPQTELDAALRAGANDALKKPFDTQTLMSKIKTLLSN